MIFVAYDQHRTDERDAHDYRVVEGAKGGSGDRAIAGDRKDGVHEHRGDNQAFYDKAKRCDHRDHSVAQHMTGDDCSRGQPLGFGCPHVVLRQNLQHALACLPDHDRQRPKQHQQYRQN